MSFLGPKGTNTILHPAWGRDISRWNCRLRLACITGSIPQGPEKRISLCQEKPFTSHISSYWSRANGQPVTHQSPVLTFRLLWSLLDCTCYVYQSPHTSVLAFHNPPSSLNSQTIPVFRLISPQFLCFGKIILSARLLSVPERDSWLLWTPTDAFGYSLCHRHKDLSPSTE